MCIACQINFDMRRPAASVALQDFAKLPWELDMPHDKAAAVLGSYLGVQNLEPASVLNLDVEQITGGCWLLMQHAARSVA